MSENQQYCVECGALTAGRFCAQCGTATSPFTAAAPADDDPTRLRMQPLSDDEATRTAAGAEAYSFYRTQHDSAPVMPPAPAEQQAPRHRGRIVAGAVAAAVLLGAAGVGAMLGRHNGTKNDGPTPVAVSASSTPTNAAPSQAAPSQPPGESSVAASTPAPHTTVAQQAPASTEAAAMPVAPPASDQPTTAQGPASPTFDPQSLPGYVESVVHNGTEYAMTREGTSVSIYTDDAGTARKEATFQLAGEPDMRPVTSTHLELVSLPSCSKPTVVFNARDEKGSAVFGWDGSGYQAYKARPNEWNMSPIGGDGVSSGTYGVTLDGHTIVYRDEAGMTVAQGNRFSSCTGTSGAVDELHEDSH